MLDQLKSVCVQTHGICKAGGGSCSIDQVANLIMAWTKIDEASYKMFDVPRDNSIWGEFRRWHKLVPYDSARTIVEVRYASHLTTAERRFVVAKELCHALETNSGTHTSSDQAVTDLVAELAVFSTATIPGASLPIAAEKLAEVGAIELYMPVALRKDLISSGEYAREGNEGMIKRFNLPPEYVELAFKDDYIAVVETMV